MFHQTRDFDAVLDALATRDLELRDISVLLALVAHMDRYGRVHVTGTAIAERLGVKPAVCIASLTRLKRQQLVVRAHDRSSGQRYFLVNPFLFSVGGSQRRGHLWAQFKAAIED